MSEPPFQPTTGVQYINSRITTLITLTFPFRASSHGSGVQLTIGIDFSRSQFPPRTSIYECDKASERDKSEMIRCILTVHLFLAALTVASAEKLKDGHHRAKEEDRFADPCSAGECVILVGLLPPCRNDRRRQI